VFSRWYWQGRKKKKETYKPFIVDQKREKEENEKKEKNKRSSRLIL
jgi:hypothetical protein